MISLISFNKNDNYLVPLQVKRFFNSIECQTNKNFELLFADCSAGEPLECSRSANTNIYQWPFPEPITVAYIRNCLSMQAKGEFICHINSDCMYSPNFVDTLQSVLTEDNIVFCRRKSVHWMTWQPSVHFISQAYHEWIDAKFDSYGTTGECQALSKENFISLGGYYNLIKDGQSTPANWEIHGYAEDSDIYQRTMGLKRVYIDQMPNVWILHLGHPVRDSRAQWEHNKNTKKKG